MAITAGATIYVTTQDLRVSLAELEGALRAETRVATERLERIESWMLRTESNRFTNKDGLHMKQRIEKLEEEHDQIFRYYPTGQQHPETRPKK
jgi:hypothetical protein